jgi:hypothetical protein
MQLTGSELGFIFIFTQIQKLKILLSSLMRQQADMSARAAGLSRDCSMTSDETDETRENEEKIKNIDAKIKETAPTIHIIKIEV